MWNQKIKVTSLLISSLILSGCSSYQVMLDANPPGAHVWCSGKDLGMAPVIRTYENETKLATLWLEEPCQAYWRSGASASFSGKVNARPGGRTILTATRFKFDPGLEEDIEVAKLVIMKRMIQQAVADSMPARPSYLDQIMTRSLNNNQNSLDLIPMPSATIQPIPQPKFGLPDVYSVDRINDNLYGVRKVR